MAKSPTSATDRTRSNRAAKLHPELSMWRDVLAEFTVTDGKRRKRSVWRQKLRPEIRYVNDSHYGSLTSSPPCLAT